VVSDVHPHRSRPAEPAGLVVLDERESAHIASPREHDVAAGKTMSLQSLGGFTAYSTHRSLIDASPHHVFRHDDRDAARIRRVLVRVELRPEWSSLDVAVGGVHEGAQAPLTPLAHVAPRALSSQPPPSTPPQTYRRCPRMLLLPSPSTPRSSSCRSNRTAVGRLTSSRRLDGRARPRSRCRQLGHSWDRSGEVREVAVAADRRAGFAERSR